MPGTPPATRPSICSVSHAMPAARASSALPAANAVRNAAGAVARLNASERSNCATDDTGIRPGKIGTVIPASRAAATNWK